MGKVVFLAAVRKRIVEERLSGSYLHWYKSLPERKRFATNLLVMSFAGDNSTILTCKGPFFDWVDENGGLDEMCTLEDLPLTFGDTLPEGGIWAISGQISEAWDNEEGVFDFAIEGVWRTLSSNEWRSLRNLCTKICKESQEENAKE